MLTHPTSTKHPHQRPRLKMPNQKKIPPLIQWAMPLKMEFPFYGAGVKFSSCAWMVLGAS